MTVVIAIPVLLLGGTEMQTLNLAKALISAGYKITVCCYYEYDQNMVSRFDDAGAKVILMRYERAKGLWHLAKGLFRIFRDKKPDIVHVQYIAPGFVPIIAAKLAGVKIVFATVHQPGNVYGWKEKLLLRMAARFCSAFFSVSKSVEKSWFGDSELFDLQKFSKERKHFTIYNAVDVESIQRIIKETEREALKKSLGIEGKKVVGVIGRLRWEKGQAVLIDAMAEVVKTISDVVLLVVGDGPDRMSLEQRAKLLKLSDHIQWLGQKNHEEVYRLYSIMDVVAVPSLFEGFGLVAVEAIAAGVPVVASSVGGLQEIIENDITGYLSLQGDSAGLSSLLLKFFSVPGTDSEIVRKGRMRAEILFSFASFQKTILSAYSTFTMTES